MKQPKITIPDVMHVDKKGNVVRKPLVATFDPVNITFVVTLPKEICNEHNSGVLRHPNVATLVEEFEQLMNDYQRNLLLAGAEEMIWLHVLHLSETLYSASVFMQAQPALVRRDKVTGLITHATAVVNGAPGKTIDLERDRPIFLASTDENRAKVDRLLGSIDSAYKTIASIASRDQAEWQAAFDSIIEMHSTMVPANAASAPADPPPAEPVQQSLPLADDEEL